MPRDLQQGDAIFQTKFTELAAVLSALDFDFWDDECPVRLQEVGGAKKVIYFFEVESKHGVQAQEVHKAWKNSEQYCADNLNTPIATAIAAVKNLRTFNTAVKEGNPVIPYQV